MAAAYVVPILALRNSLIARTSAEMSFSVAFSSLDTLRPHEILDCTRHMLHEVESIYEFDDLALTDICNHRLLDPHVQFLNRHVPSHVRIDPTNRTRIVVKCL